MKWKWLNQRCFFTFQLRDIKDANRAHFTLVATSNCWGYLIFKNMKSFQSSILNYMNQSHIQSLLPPSTMLTGILFREADQGSQAGLLRGYPPNLIFLWVLCSNQQKTKINMRETLRHSMAKRCNIGVTEKMICSTEDFPDSWCFSLKPLKYT